MKKLLLLLALGMLLVSCDYIMKKRGGADAEVKTDKKVVLGNDKDDKGCVASAGYRWSLVRKECIRIFEEGYRLNRISELKTDDDTEGAFVVFDKERNEAELFLPTNPKSFLLKKEKDGRYKNGNWLLLINEGFTLKNRGHIMYAGATVQENKIISDDQQESALVQSQKIDTVKTAAAE